MSSITFGSGCLVFPLAIYNLGPLIGLLVFIFVSIVSYWTIYLLIYCGMNSGIMDYNGLLEKYIGVNYRIFSDINNIILCIGVIMSYQNICSDFSIEVLKTFGVLGENEKEKTDNIKILIMLGMMLFFQIPLSTLQDISQLQFASLVGTFALIFTIIVITILTPHNYGQNIEHNKLCMFRKIELFSIFDSMAFIAYGYSSHNGIFPIFQELVNPTKKRNIKILNRSMALETILYLIIAYLGFMSAYPELNSNLLSSKVYADNIPISVGKIFLIVCLTCTMAINYNIMRQSFKTMFFNNEEISKCKNIILVSVMYILMNLLTYFITSISTILSFVGGFCTCVICFINPFWIYINFENLPKTSIKFILCVITGFVMCVVGLGSTGHSVYDMINKTNSTQENYSNFCE
jgi:amino acid permease